MLEVAFSCGKSRRACPAAVGDQAGRHEKRVFTIGDLDGVGTIRANSALPGFRVSEQPVLARDRLRHVGEAIAACVAASRAAAEDLAATCRLDYEALPAVSDMRTAHLPTAPLLHDGWSVNAFLETRRDDDVSGLDDIAAAKVTRTLRTSRQCMAPIEGRGVLAEWDPRLEQLIVTTSTQMPHVTKTGLADCLGLDEGRCASSRPTSAAASATRASCCPRRSSARASPCSSAGPVRWLEDRFEQLTAGANCREHHYVITAWADREGRLLGMECEATSMPAPTRPIRSAPVLEAAQVGSILPGPYCLPRLRCHTISACTNKPPILPYRGVARTGVCYAMETTLDSLARQLGISAQGHPARQPRAARGDCPIATLSARCSTAATIRNRCAVRWPPSTSTGSVRDGPGERPWASVSQRSATGPHGTSVYHAWGIPSSRASSRRMCVSVPTGARGARWRAQPRSGHGDDTRAGGARNPGSSSRPGARGGTATRRSRPTPRAPGAAGRWSWRAARWPKPCRQLAERIAGVGAALLQVPAAEVEVGGGRCVAKTPMAP
jgi:carbon-monoxide dehydrogenase large subunit